MFVTALSAPGDFEPLDSIVSYSGGKWVLQEFLLFGLAPTPPVPFSATKFSTGGALSTLFGTTGFSSPFATLLALLAPTTIDEVDVAGLTTDEVDIGLATRFFFFLFEGIFSISLYYCLENANDGPFVGTYNLLHFFETFTILLI
jgi:hypothetical protein